MISSAITSLTCRTFGQQARTSTRPLEPLAGRPRQKSARANVRHERFGDRR